MANLICHANIRMRLFGGRYIFRFSFGKIEHTFFNIGSASIGHMIVGIKKDIKKPIIDFINRIRWSDYDREFNI